MTNNYLSGLIIKEYLFHQKVPEGLLEGLFPEENDETNYLVLLCDSDSKNFAGFLTVFLNASFVDEIETDSFQILIYKKKDFTDAIQKSKKYLNEYLQKHSSFNNLFLVFSRPVFRLENIGTAYQEAKALFRRKYYYDYSTHILFCDSNDKGKVSPYNEESFLSAYTSKLCERIQTNNEKNLEQVIHELKNELFLSSLSELEIKLLLSDLYLRINDTLIQRFPSAPFDKKNNNKFIHSCFFSNRLCDTVNVLQNHCNLFTDALSSSKDKVLNDILYYIQNNYQKPLKLDTIAPLFGYNSAYLGKLFSQNVGEGFRSYLDRIRIEEAKKLLTETSLKVYQIAEMTGYKNVDYFHIKFLKYTNTSPAEFRKEKKQ